ncbi:MAG: DNA recombination protein RmuC [Deferrisomatales bacterium]
MAAAATDPFLLTLLLLAAGGLLAALAAAAASWKTSARLARLEGQLAGELERLRGAVERASRDAIEAAGRTHGELALRLTGRLEESHRAVMETLVCRLQHLHEGQSESFAALQGRVADQLTLMRRENEDKLEQIRGAVEERLHSALEARLGQSFRLVSERLEEVHKGLGEMQALASGVGDLKRVLTNVRTRGTFGEVRLEALLEQVLVGSQYAKNVATVPGSRHRVEFALRLPGRGGQGSAVWLPIDAKFPQEDYLRLQEAYEAGDAEAVEAARRGLRTRLLAEAATVREKYLDPPHTTDFALLFVPTEGLYAEALRLDGLVEAMQRRSHVVLVGPTTLYAVLNSLQMGFHTLAIEKRSAEVWRILGGVKAEFGKFGRSLAEVKKKLQEASNKIELSERRSRAMERQLRDVEALPEGEAAPELPETEDGRDA